MSKIPSQVQIDNVSDINSWKYNNSNQFVYSNDVQILNRKDNQDLSFNSFSSNSNLRGINDVEKKNRVETGVYNRPISLPKSGHHTYLCEKSLKKSVYLLNHSKLRASASRNSTKIKSLGINYIKTPTWTRKPKVQSRIRTILKQDLMQSVVPDYEQYRRWKKQMNKCEGNSLNSHQNKSLNHSDIKQLLGGHHTLMKTNNDYLSVEKIKAIKYRSEWCSAKPYRKQLKIRSAYYQKIQKQQKYVKKQLKCIQNKIIEQKNILEELEYQNQNEYVMRVKSDQRAPLILYLKCQQQKRLFQFIVSIDCQGFEDNRFIDQQFSYTIMNNQLHEMKSKQFQLVYIQPNEKVNLFPLQQYKLNSEGQKIYEYVNKKWKLIRNSNIKQMSVQHKDQLFIVNFIQIIFLMQPYAITRLFEPVVANVYNVWLFFNGEFSPVFVDGYFPIQNHPDGHFQFMNSGIKYPAEYFWLPILLKCICKVYNMYEYNKLSQLNPYQIYTLLTGTNITKVSQQYLVQCTSQKFYQLIQKYIQHGNICISYQSSNISILCPSKVSKNIISYNPVTDTCETFSSFHRKMQDIIILPLNQYLCMYMHKLVISLHQVIKFQIVCHTKTRVVFSDSNSSTISKNNSVKQISKRQWTQILIYQLEQSHMGSKRLLKLRMRKRLLQDSRIEVKLHARKYYIFMSNQQNKGDICKFIKLFNDHKNIEQDPSSNREEQQSGENRYILLMADKQIKLGQRESIRSENKRIEDKDTNYYKYRLKNLQYMRQA